MERTTKSPVLVVSDLLQNYDSCSHEFDQPLLSKGRILEYFEAGLRAFQPGDKIGDRFLIERFLVKY
jgi:hypothetical protein